jgi:hypothetical protein
MKTTKSYLARLLVICIALFPVLALAAVPPASLTSGNYSWEVERGLSSSFSHGGCTFPDTVTGTGDTCVLLFNYQFESGYDYALAMGKHPYSTTTTGDSVFIKVNYKDQNKVLMFDQFCDTLVGAAGLKGSITMLPVNRNCFIPGGYCDIVITSTALSTRLFVNTYTSLQLLKRKAINYPKSWPFK